MNVNQALTLRIKELLKEHKITRYRLSMNSGVSHETLNNIIHDSLLSTIILISGGFDMTVSEFLDSPLFQEDNLNL